MLRAHVHACLQIRDDLPAAAPPRDAPARRHLARRDRGALQALRGLRREAERDPRQARRCRPLRREPDLLGASRAEGRAHLRDRRDQEPRGLLRPSRRQRRRPRWRLREAREARLRLGRRVARRPQGDRHRGPRLGLDGVRLGRRPPLQLHRRRAEHVRPSGTRRRSLRSTSTSTRTSSTTRPTVRRTSRRSSPISTGMS